MGWCLQWVNSRLNVRYYMYFIRFFTHYIIPYTRLFSTSPKILLTQQNLYLITKKIFLIRIKFALKLEQKFLSRKRFTANQKKVVIPKSRPPGQNYIKVQGKIFFLRQTRVSSIKDQSLTVSSKTMQIQNQFRSWRAYKPKIYPKCTIL